MMVPLVLRSVEVTAVLGYTG